MSVEHRALEPSGPKNATVVAATEHINAAKKHAPNLPQDAYGAFLRTALDVVAEAIFLWDITKRPSAPGPTA
ncbi:hypothetical protein [Streptomyces nodosus]|uniref:hypothetical protein n=1 Tax=Streptomyces nodosus TaxID=40318 RepID=UPI0013923AD9|nr:hypothetical protein [Streptomyces nodosus]MBB4795085.1 hypothetical protein [Streptomyces nodosus]